MSAHVLQDELFSTFDLRERLDNQRSRLDEVLAALDEHRLLNTAPKALIDYFIAAYRIEPPALRRHEWQAETDDHGDFEGNAASHRLDIDIPFYGDAEWFGAQAGPWAGTSGAVRISGQSLILTFEIKRGAEQAARTLIDREVNEIEKALAWIRQEVAAYNDSLSAIVETVINTRRTRLLSHQALAQTLGIPLHKRSDGPLARLTPASRGQLFPELPPMGHGPDLPEPTLSRDQHEQIVETLQSAITLLAYSPSLFATWNEAPLRNYLGIALNGQFERPETIEPFVPIGYSALGLRHGERIACLADCLFWKSAEAYREQLDYLLAHPLSREARLILLVFHRGQRLTRTINDVRAQNHAHPAYQEAPEEQPEHGSEVTLRLPDDPMRTVRLTILVFKAPKAQNNVITPHRKPHRKAEPNRTQIGFDF
ncbi:hypothetical protein [Pseudomonas sp.]|uniref:hypothetical protein n=1 Tax=Pseudomonas sp. TaxID=306 RepID=UPI002897AA8B|nr:hypothetical protein [Pseudomonas sp.]